MILYAIFVRLYYILRLFLYSLIMEVLAFTNVEIHYLADIKGGINIFHPSLGIVINVHSKIGKNLTLAGGNSIGIRKKCSFWDIIFGENVSLGINAVILDPTKIAKNVKIGALCCVVKIVKKMEPFSLVCLVSTFQILWMKINKYIN